MKTVVDKASSRGYANHGWLKTYHTFSFAGYYNPERINFGKLRVLNDDSVLPLEGFDTHPHKNMEVVSIPLRGELRHGDNIKNSEVITPGDIQVMSTGKGIYHSEYNDSENQLLEFLQIWIMPRELNTEPVYKNYDIRPLLTRNEFGLFISPDGETPASILQDAWFSMGSFDAGREKEYKLHRENTGVYVFVIDGKAEIEGLSLAKRDGAGFWETDSIHIRFIENSTLLLIEVPME